MVGLNKKKMFDFISTEYECRMTKNLEKHVMLINEDAWKMKVEKLYAVVNII